MQERKYRFDYAYNDISNYANSCDHVVKVLPFDVIAAVPVDPALSFHD